MRVCSNTLFAIHVLIIGFAVAQKCEKNADCADGERCKPQGILRRELFTYDFANFGVLPSEFKPTEGCNLILQTRLNVRMQP
jgi:hypothetical protein